MRNWTGAERRRRGHQPAETESRVEENMYRISDDNRECRKVFGDTLRSLMTENPDVVYLEADLAGAIGTAGLFRDFPEQAFDLGIMEANMVGVAGGMSLRGKIPFVHSFGTFASRRCADQTFMAGCYNRASIRIIGTDPGVTAEANGGTHMPFEDIGVYRSFPGITILDIAEPQLLEAVLRQTAERYGVYYIRFPRKWKTSYYAGMPAAEIGKAAVIRDGSDGTVIASGIEVTAALQAAEALETEGLDIRVVDMFTVKPVDEEMILRCCRETGAIVSAENHNRIGGLGSAVAEVIAEKGQAPFERVGVPDCFGEVGDKAFLSQRFGIGAESIAEAMKRVIKRK